MSDITDPKNNGQDPLKKTATRGLGAYFDPGINVPTPSRRQRRLLAKLDKPGRKVRSETHNQLTIAATELALKKYGKDRATQTHAEAITSTIGRLTHLATGWAHKELRISPKGACRLVRGLPCGGGKTLSAKAWMATVVHMGLDLSVAFAANEVEALCRTKRDLIESFGVPADQIGLLHTYRYDPTKASEGASGYASEPPTPIEELQEKRLLLVTHNMVRTGEQNVALYNRFQDKPRSVVIYDETLLRADANSVRSWHVRQACSWITDYIAEHKTSEDTAQLEPVARYVQRCAEIITNDQAKIVQLPELTSYGAGLQPDNAIARLPSGAPGTLRVLLENTSRTLRLMHEANRSAGWFEIKVPDELRRVMVLDASHNIRALGKLGTNLVHDTKDIALRVNYAGTTIETFLSRSGRGAIEEECGKSVARRKLAKALADWIKSRPDGERVLVWTFKKQDKSRAVDVPNELAEALEHFGVDLSRVVIETHGRAQGSNEYAWARWCACYGIFEPATHQVASQILGELVDLKADLSGLEEITKTEILHVLYQELSRCCVRNITHGQAMPAGFWAPTYDRASYIEPLVGSDIFPGAKIIHLAEHDDKKMLQAEKVRREAAVLNQVTKAILDVLEGLPVNVDKISSSKMKPLVDAAVGFTVPDRTFSRARSTAGLEGRWERVGRSFLRITPDF